MSTHAVNEVCILFTSPKSQLFQKLLEEGGNSGRLFILFSSSIFIFRHQLTSRYFQVQLWAIVIPIFMFFISINTHLWIIFRISVLILIPIFIFLKYFYRNICHKKKNIFLLSENNILVLRLHKNTKRCCPI